MPSPDLQRRDGPRGQRDYFGGLKAKQAIVCAILRGPEENYALAEDISKRMYAPVMRSHRASVDQMAILEPVLSETVCATCLTVIREATDEVEVTVERVDLTDVQEIVAICARGRRRQAIPILDLPLPIPPPRGSEWIEAYRRWAGRR